MPSPKRHERASERLAPPRPTVTAAAPKTRKPVFCEGPKEIPKIFPHFLAAAVEETVKEASTGCTATHICLWPGRSLCLSLSLCLCLCLCVCVCVCVCECVCCTCCICLRLLLMSCIIWLAVYRHPSTRGRGQYVEADVQWATWPT